MEQRVDRAADAGAILISEKTEVHVNARYYNEFGAENRLEGESLYLTATIPF